MVRESSLFPPQFQLLLFSGFTQQCHFGAFGIGSCFKSALITRRCVNRQQAQSAKMTIRIIVPGFISTDLLSLHTRQRLVQQIFELDQLLLRKIDTSLHCLRNIKRPLFQCFTFFSQRKKGPALIVLQPDTVNISLFIEPLRERCQSSILCFSLCLVALYVSITVTTSKSQPQPAENQDFFCNPALFLLANSGGDCSPPPVTLCIDQLVIYDLYCPVPDVVHPLHPQHLILCFELFCHALTLCHLLCQQKHLLLRLFVDVGQIGI